MLTFIAAVFVFGITVFVHELGHFILARLSGIRVLELALGLGPKLVGFRRNEINYSLRIFPVGGYCRMLGESPEEANEPNSFPSKPALHRAAVTAVGPSMNLLLALVILFVIFFFLVGTPRTDTTILGQVFKDSPAAAAGLQPGDTVISIDAVPVHNWAEMVALIESRPDETVAIVVRRDGEELEYAVQIEAVPEAGKGMIGVAAPVQKYRFAASLATSLERFGDVILSMYHVITGQAPFDVIGPVGIIITVGEVAQTGFINLLWLMSLFNISLGLLNLLPVPALDGGRLLFILVEAIRGRPLDPEKEALIHFIGFAVLMVLTLLVTYNDLLRWDIFPGR